MNSKCIILFALIAIVAARPEPRPDSPSHDDHNDSYGEDDHSYQFWYEVDEEDHYDREVNFGHHEEKDDDGKVTGYYFVLLPDGRKQKVEYYVDGYSGFVADVTYEGEASYENEDGYDRKPKDSYEFN